MRDEDEEAERAPDLVNHPPHYTAHPSGVECIEISEALPFCLGNALKYIWRAGQKEGVSREQDIWKAIWYLNRERWVRSGLSPHSAEDAAFRVLGCETRSTLLFAALHCIVTGVTDKSLATLSARLEDSLANHPA